MRGLRATRIGRRLLREQTFELMVSPAIADLQFESDRAGVRPAAYSAVAAGLVGGFVEDMRLDLAELATDLPGLLQIVAVQTCYYTTMLTLIGGAAFKQLSGPHFLFLGTLILSLSTVSTLVCYWPKRFTDIVGVPD